MDAATLARAAEPFFTTKEVGKGSGLGLSMAHGFAAQSGGALRIESTPGQGTVVTLWLPEAAAWPVAAAAEGRRSDMNAGPAHPQGASGRASPRATQLQSLPSAAVRSSGS